MPFGAFRIWIHPWTGLWQLLVAFGLPELPGLLGELLVQWQGKLRNPMAACLDSNPQTTFYHVPG